MKRKHHPIRTCLGCNARDDQRVLIRLVIRANGELRIDRSGEGRGGYLHKAEECWEAFLRKKSLYRAFRMDTGREAREKLIKSMRG